MVFQCLELRIQSLVVSQLTTHVPASTAKKVGVCYVCARVQIDVSKNDSKNVLQTDSKHGKPGRTVSGHGDLEETALREIGFEIGRSPTDLRNGFDLFGAESSVSAPRKGNRHRDRGRGESAPKAAS